MSDKSKLGVILVCRDRFDLYTPLLANMLTYYFPKPIISDLEVKKKEDFEIEIQNLVTRNKINPSSFILVLSEEASFVTDIAQSPEYQYNAEMANFLDIVPFENPCAKLYLLEKGARIVATNRDLLDLLKNAFDRQGCFINYVIPAAVIKKPLISSHGFTKEIAEELISKVDVMKSFDMLLSSQHIQVARPIMTNDKKPTKSNAPILLVVFFILLAILGIMIFKLGI